MWTFNQRFSSKWKRSRFCRWILSHILCGSVHRLAFTVGNGKNDYWNLVVAIHLASTERFITICKIPLLSCSHLYVHRKRIATMFYFASSFLYGIHFVANISQHSHSISTLYDLICKIACTIKTSIISRDDNWKHMQNNWNFKRTNERTTIGI